MKSTKCNPGAPDDRLFIVLYTISVSFYLTSTYPVHNRLNMSIIGSSTHFLKIFHFHLHQFQFSFFFLIYVTKSLKLCQNQKLSNSKLRFSHSVISKAFHSLVAIKVSHLILLFFLDFLVFQTVFWNYWGYQIINMFLCVSIYI